MSSRFADVARSLPLRCYIYMLIASSLGVRGLLLQQRPTAAEYLQAVGTILAVCEISFLSVRVLWRAYRFGVLVWIAGAGTLAALGVRSLIGGVSDDLPTMIFGFGVPIFVGALALPALLVFLARRSDAFSKSTRL